MTPNKTTATRVGDAWTGAGFPASKIPPPDEPGAPAPVAAQPVSPVPAASQAVTVEVPAGDVVQVVADPAVA